MATLGYSIESWLAPLDRVRRAVFAQAVRAPALRSLLLHKEQRVRSALLIHAAIAMVGAVWAPALLLVLGPLVLGVPHLMADLRYLVLATGLPRLLRLWILAGSLALLGASLARISGLPVPSQWELGLGLLLLSGSLLPRLRGNRRGQFLAAFSVFSIAAFAWFAPAGFRLALAHGHNLFALSIWAFLFARTNASAKWTALMLLAPALLLLATPLAELGFQMGVQQAFGLHTFAAADELAPFLTDPGLALAVVATFAYLQSVHYAIWLVAIPEACSKKKAPSSFRRSFRQLGAELGLIGLSASVLLAIAFALALFFRPLGARSLYLSLANFHGYLELAVVLYWVRRGAPG